MADSTGEHPVHDPDDPAAKLPPPRPAHVEPLRVDQGTDADTAEFDAAAAWRIDTSDDPVAWPSPLAGAVQPPAAAPPPAVSPPTSDGPATGDRTTGDRNADDRVVDRRDRAAHDRAADVAPSGTAPSSSDVSTREHASEHGDAGPVSGDFSISVDSGDSADTGDSGEIEIVLPAAPPPQAVLALDIGGSGFSAGIVTMQGDLVDRIEIGVDRDAGPHSQLTNLATILDAQIERAERHHHVQLVAVGIASNGPIDQASGTVSPQSLPMWKRFALRDHVAELTHLPTFLELDARALALAEGWLSAARGLSDFAVIIVSNSVEGALVIDGELVDGATHHAGQIGHVIVKSGGRRCACGSRGCLDAEASSLAIEAVTGRSASEPTYDIMRQTGRYVGRAAANVCNALDIGLVVVGGSVAMNFAATFFNAAQEELDQLTNLGTGKPRITRTRLGSQGTLLGAGAVGIRGLRRSRRQAAA